MVIISIRDFRANQTKYLGMVNAGEDVILKARTGSYKITPVKEKDMVTSKKDFAAELRGALIEAKECLNGNRKLKTLNQLIDELRDNDK
ncbi:MAG: prevent-host-death family protein [Prevotella sp.]|jgi:antitoxin (DNA-binding transcriptional repressor) of toxin-antitoxin stability system|nr:prevent-host-death family protein [Prevotella sp.]MCH4018159.1 prevent-host-death family protein [Prevotella sp.]MCI1324101.1 prevent-host-death family protein [Prevotella sp.]MCI1348530.1 prevent-host-death family protein [Prevotella sp.]MCI1686390.1 prevent-host-death family protein [Prevotella sp.]MCI2138392.1 prevent-host-death family protein [Prevotella sp.]